MEIAAEDGVVDLVADEVAVLEPDIDILRHREAEAGDALVGDARINQPKVGD